MSFELENLLNYRRKQILFYKLVNEKYFLSLQQK